MKAERESSTSIKTEILVVEDSPTQAAQIKYLLETYNYNVNICQNGQQAWGWLKVNKPSIVISDIIMPVMNGFDLCEKIKSDKVTEDIPVILLTSLSDPDEVIEGLSCGADSFITKPYNKEYLLSNIEKILIERNSAGSREKSLGLEIRYGGKTKLIRTEPQKVVNLLINIYQGAIHKNNELVRVQEELSLLNERLESLVVDRTVDLTAEVKLSNQISDRLKESEVKWRSLVTNTPEYIGLVDCEGKFLFLNHYAKGFSEKDTIGKSHLEFISNEWKELYRQKFEKCLNTKKNQIFEYTAFGDNYSIRTYETCFVPIIEHGNVSNVMSIARDITAYKSAEEMIRNLARFPSENPDPILRCDLNGILLYANEACHKFLPWKLQIGKKVHQSLLNSVMKSIREGIIDIIETEHHQRIFSLKIVPVAKEGYANLYGRDITEIQEAEKEILNLNAQLEQRVIERTYQLEAANKELESFAYSVSHDLRAPLRAIDGFSKFVLEDYESKLDTEGKRLLNLIRTSTQKMDQLITDLLDLSRVTMNELNYSAIDMTQMAISIFNETAQDDTKNNIRLTVDQLPGANGDPAFIKQVWINLISNAIKFSSKKKIPVIKIGGKIENNTTTYFIKDNGAGFDQAYVHKLFGVFQRLHTSDDFEGTGIGLAIVQRIINRHGGKVWAEGKGGKGATFYFSLPVKKSG
jgi:PAS domain S-box-containing protein